MHPTHRAVSTGPGCSAGSLSVRLHLIPALAALVLFAAASPGLRAGNAPAPPAAPPTEATEPTGTVVIHVPRAGFLRFLGHSHRIEARDVSVAVDWPGGEAAPVSVSVEVPVDALEVTDGEPSEENRAKVREEMLGPKVLDAENHPVVRFVSSAITKLGSGGWRAAGTLTVRGVDRAVTLDVEPRPGEDGIFSASGRIELRPADYGIAPVTALGGTVRTADTIEIKFTARGIRSGD